MKYLIILSSFFLLISISCNNLVNTVLIPGALSFTITKTEKVIPNTNKRYKEEFFSYFDEIKIPLFKVIKAKKYTIFTSIPFNNSLDELCNEKLVKTSFKETNKLYSTKNSCYKSYTNNTGSYFAEYTVAINNTVFYTLVATKDPKVIKDQFSIESIEKRIINLAK